MLVRVAEGGWRGAVDALVGDPVFWIISTLPLVALAVAYVAGREFDEVRLLAESLEELVEARTQKLAVVHQAMAERTAEHARWLAVLHEGVACFDAEGRLFGERSPAFNRLIPHAAEARTVDRLLERCGAETETVAIVRSILFENGGVGAPFETTVEMLPKTWAFEENGQCRQVAFHYCPLRGEGGALLRVLIVAEDQSGLRAARARQAEALGRVDRLSAAAFDAEAYAGFADEVAARLEAVDQMRAEPNAPSPRLLAILRTLKGTLGAFAYEEPADICHQLETAYGCGEPTDPLWTALWRTWRRQSQDVAKSLGLRQARLVPVAPQRLVALRQALGRSDLDAAKEAARALSCHHPQRVMARYARYVATRSRRAQKQVCWTLAPDATDVSYHEVQRVDTALLQLFDNAILHAAPVGRPTQLTVSIRRREDAGLAWSVEDDGTGIDGDELAARALQAGLRSEEWVETASAQAKIELCFVDGLSVLGKGRDGAAYGAGLSAARACVRGLGGDLRVSSTPGAGTRFELWIPGQASMDLRRWTSLRADEPSPAMSGGPVAAAEASSPAERASFTS